jgi:hypothetical protein
MERASPSSNRSFANFRALARKMGDGPSPITSPIFGHRANSRQIAPDPHLASNAQEALGKSIPSTLEPGCLVTPMNGDRPARVPDGDIADLRARERGGFVVLPKQPARGYRGEAANSDNRSSSRNCNDE